MLTEAQAHIAFNVLVLRAGADPTQRDAFVQYVTGPHTIGPLEYRFQGSLGFGGKFYSRNGACHVDCYPEDATPGRLKVVNDCNVLLGLLRSEPENGHA